jgi:hypothetical protein
MPSFEVLLPLGAVGFYLFDAVVLLYGDELALELRHGRWSSSTGSRMQVGGRRPYLPNPFAPGALTFRVRWNVASNHHDDGGRVATDLWERLRPIRIVVTVQALLLLCALAPISIALGAGTPLLVLFAAFYALTLVSLGLLFQRRGALGLTRRQCGWFALEALLCAPFAVNLVRKVSLARSDDVAWIELAQARFSAAERRALLQQVGTRIDEMLCVEEPASAAAERLEALRASLRERLDGHVVA